MNQELKKKWVEALRSGKYVQGRHQLRYSTGLAHRHCCLGVLCDIQSEDQKAKGIAELGGEFWPDAYPPFALRGGLTGENMVKLSRMNDQPADDVGNRKTFDEIADWIEENL